MVSRQVGMRAMTLGDGTLAGPVRLGLTDYVLGLLDDGAADRPPVTAWLPTTLAPDLPSAPPPVPPLTFTVARVESADDATPLAWRVIPETLP